MKDQSDSEKPGLWVLFPYKYGAISSEVILITFSRALQFAGEGRHREGNQIILGTSRIIEGYPDTLLMKTLAQNHL